jgi:hypothetical protein
MLAGNDACFCHNPEGFRERTSRTVDGYRNISLNNLRFQVPKAIPSDTLNLRIYPLNSFVSELRIWKHNSLLDVRKIKNADLKGVHF